MSMYVCFYEDTFINTNVQMFINVQTHMYRCLYIHIHTHKCKERERERDLRKGSSVCEGRKYGNPTYFTWLTQKCL